MESSNKSSSLPRNPVDWMTTDLLLSLATVPALLALVGAKSLSKTIQDVGVLSEELFRGDRLPLLNMPELRSTAVGDSHPN
jgi:hypothetical protein